MRTISFAYRPARLGRSVEKTRANARIGYYLLCGAVIALLPLGRALADDNDQKGRSIPSVIVSSTVPANGDLNPYGVAFVPRGFPHGGPLKPGDLLVSNFNNSSNQQGTTELIPDETGQLCWS